MVSKLQAKPAGRKVDRRTFLKGAAATLGGAAFLGSMVASNFEAAAQTNQAWVIFSDIVRGSGGSPTGTLCVETSVFTQGEQIVFRVVTYDGKTGALVNTPDEVEARGLKVTVEIEGQASPLELRFGAHPPKTPAADQHFYWATGWLIPPNVSGKLSYTIKVEDKDGGKGILEIAGFKDGKYIDPFPALLSIQKA